MGMNVARSRMLKVAGTCPWMVKAGAPPGSRDGLVHRTVHPTVPPQVDYGPTPLGETLPGPVGEVARWASQDRSGIQEAREPFDAAADPGPD
jgi:hypothetical protein